MLLKSNSRAGRTRNWMSAEDRSQCRVTAALTRTLEGEPIMDLAQREAGCKET
jgi:hypothetical protein